MKQLHSSIYSLEVESAKVKTISLYVFSKIIFSHLWLQCNNLYLTLDVDGRTSHHWITPAFYPKISNVAVRKKNIAQTTKYAIT